MAKLVSTLQSNPNGGGSMPMQGAPQNPMVPGANPSMPGSPPVPDPSVSLSANVGPSGAAASMSS